MTPPPLAEDLDYFRLLSLARSSREDAVEVERSTAASADNRREALHRELEKEEKRLDFCSDAIGFARSVLESEPIRKPTDFPAGRAGIADSATVDGAVNQATELTVSAEAAVSAGQAHEAAITSLKSLLQQRDARIEEEWKQARANDASARGIVYHPALSSVLLIGLICGAIQIVWLAPIFGLIAGLYALSEFSGSKSTYVARVLGRSVEAGDSPFADASGVMNRLLLKGWIFAVAAVGGAAWFVALLVQQLAQTTM